MILMTVIFVMMYVMSVDKTMENMIWIAIKHSYQFYYHKDKVVNHMTVLGAQHVEMEGR